MCCRFAAGHVVGDYLDGGGKYHGFVLAEGSYTTLDVPGALNTFAYGINNLDQVVGGSGAGGFLGTPAPIPEPSTAMLLALATLALVAWTAWLGRLTP